MCEPLTFRSLCFGCGMDTLFVIDTTNGTAKCSNCYHIRPMAHD